MADRRARTATLRNAAIGTGFIVIIAAASHHLIKQLPSVQGEISRVAQTRVGARPAWILVEVTPHGATGEKVTLNLQSAIVLVHREHPNDARWRVGRHVKVRYRDPALASYPIQADAVIVELL